MSLSELAARKGRPPRTCGACWVLAQLDDKDAADLRAALANPAVEYDEVLSELRIMGFDVDRGALSRHAHGQCAAHEVLRR